jgi:hypothetical protein
MKARLANLSFQPRPFEGRKARRLNPRDGAADGLSPNRPWYYERRSVCRDGRRHDLLQHVKEA